MQDRSSILTPLLIIAFLQSPPFAGIASGQDIAERPKITVTGEGVMEVAPDQIVIGFSVVTLEATPSKASEVAREKAASIIEFLKSSGVTPKQIQSQALRIDPVFRERVVAQIPSPLQKAFAAPNTQVFSNADDPFSPKQKATRILDAEESLKLVKPIGYESTRDMSVRLTDLATFETVYAGILERGVNEVSSVDRDHSDFENLKVKAQIRALEDAKTKAELMTKVLGVGVGGVLDIRENNRNRSLIISTTSDPFGDEPDGFSAGTIKVYSSVSVVFEITQ